MPEPASLPGPVGFLVGYIVRHSGDEMEFDSTGVPIFDSLSYRLHPLLATARAEHAELADNPEMRVYALTDITDRMDS